MKQPPVNSSAGAHAAPLRVVVFGATGYTGAELVALLKSHPRAEVVAFVSATSAGEDVAAHLPVWRGQKAMQFLPPKGAAQTPCDVVFFATPHEAAMRYAGELLQQGKTVIDLSAAFRLADEGEFCRWYGDHTAPQLLPQAVYGLPEAGREKIASAQLIACPGCYATAAILGLLPLAAGGHLRGNVVIDAKSGVSGAGRASGRTDLLLAEMANNFTAYALDGHRHLPEILQALRPVAGGKLPKVFFVPHLLPVARGIHANIHAPVADAAAAAAATRAHWQNEPFVEALPEGKTAQMAEATHGNRAIVSAHVLAADQLLVSVVIDNLLKGAAGQALQNMNIRFGLPEACGLPAALGAAGRAGA